MRRVAAAAKPLGATHGHRERDADTEHSRPNRRTDRRCQCLVGPHASVWLKVEGSFAFPSPTLASTYGSAPISSSVSASSVERYSVVVDEILRRRAISSMHYLGEQRDAAAPDERARGEPRAGVAADARERVRAAALQREREPREPRLDEGADETTRRRAGETTRRRDDDATTTRRRTSEPGVAAPRFFPNTTRL